MVKAFLLASALTAMASAAGLSLTIGPPVAAGPGVKYVKKTAALFAVRLEDCADPLSAQISATGLHAGRLANGDRPSVAMQVVPAGTGRLPGVGGTASDH